MEKHKKQAERNGNLSHKLYEEGEYLDWSCITAFYSALHWVYCKILPKEYNGKLCYNMEEAMTMLRANNKHDATSIMVRLSLPNISKDYDFLKNLSFTARYISGEIDQPTAKICQKKLKKIKEEISK